MSSSPIPSVGPSAVTPGNAAAGNTPPNSAPSASAPAGKGFHIPALDGIRAVAFAIVFASHAISERMIPGGFGVTIFFFLSGYLITTLLRLEHAKTGTVSLSKFYARRALRIFPNFYLVLVVATLLAMAGTLEFIGGRISGWGVFWQALYGNNYYSIFHGDQGTALGTGVFWSLAVEEHFYFVFPALYLLLTRASARAMTHVAVLGAICALVLAWRCALVFASGMSADAYSSYTYKASDARFDSMLFGCMLALVGNPVLDRQRGGQTFWLGVMTPLAVAVLLVTFLVRDDAFRATLRYTLQGIALVPLFIVAIRFHAHPLFAWLNWRWVRYAGVLTYTLYLVHLIVFFKLAAMLGTDTAGRKALVAALTLAASLAIAVAMHHLIERPLAGRRKRLHAERSAGRPGEKSVGEERAVAL